MTLAVDDKLESLVLDLLEWIAKEPRSYQQTMDAWRTSCPRLAVWEEAVDRGFVVRESAADGVRVSCPDAAIACRRVGVDPFAEGRQVRKTVAQHVVESVKLLIRKDQPASNHGLASGLRRAADHRCQVLSRPCLTGRAGSASS